jgi:hypothetical protein
MHTKKLAIIIICTLLQLPFLNKAFHIDSDMMINTAQQMLISPMNPPLGEYGKHMVLHNTTEMPKESIFYRNPHPPLIPLLLSPVLFFFGENEIPVHLFFLLFYILTVFSGYYFFQLYLRSNLLFVATLIWALSPALFVNSQNAMYDVPVTFFIISSLIMFIKGTRSEKRNYYIVSGIFLGLGALTKMTVVPLYAICGGYLVLKREWKNLLWWAIPALLFPSLWVVHNIIVYGKIHYLSTGHFHPILCDIRYRCERIISYLGGVVILPVFWYWSFYKNKLKKVWFVIIPVAIWSVLLVVYIKMSVVSALFYLMFASAGLIVIIHCCLIFKWDNRLINMKKKEAVFLSAFFLLYFLTILLLPLASVRFLIPLIPFALLFFVSLLPEDNKLYKYIIVVSTALLTIVISIGDAQYCDSDRKLPAVLTKKEYTSDKTWCFGRLSFDYYLYKAGFKNFKVLQKIPSDGEFFINEIIPGDYDTYSMLVQHIGSVVPVDTILIHTFPVKTLGAGGGFYGSGRLPYSFSIKHPQKEYVVYLVQGNDNKK